MKWIAVSGSWRTVDAAVEADVRAAVASFMQNGDGFVSGGALGVDFIATDEALKHDPAATRIKIILPTALTVFAAHFRKRAGEGVITPLQAETLIAQLTHIKTQNPTALIEMAFDVCNEQTYYARNTEVIRACDKLYGFQVNDSAGVADAMAKAQEMGKDVTAKTYRI